MAALRINVPGQPVRLVDIGPSYGRVTGQNYGGAMAVAGGTVSPRILPATTPARQAQMAEYRRARAAEAQRRYRAGLKADRGEKPRCGAMMSLAKVPCARPVGHGSDHRSRYLLENARRMRTGKNA